MVGINRLNEAAIDTFSHLLRGSRTIACVPFLVGVLHYRMYICMYVQSRCLDTDLSGACAHNLRSNETNKDQ